MSTGSAVALDAARTWLFVPGNRPDRFDKASASGADVVILDLEDAVGAADKAAAREHVRRWFTAGGQGVVRVNAAATDWGAADLELVAAVRCPVMLPKAETAEQVRQIVEGTGTEVIPLVETARGVLAAVQVCAVDGVVRPAFGSVDLAAELGIDPADRTALTFARQMLVLAAAAAGRAAPIDGVTTAVGDEAELEADIDHGRRLGFTAKLCIHPRQVGLAAALFGPTSQQLDWANRVMQGAGHGSVGVGVVDGQMVDKPVIDRARRILAAQRISPP